MYTPLNEKYYFFSLYDTIIDILLKRLAEYEIIGTTEEFKALKEKNEPKKPVGLKRNICPNCSWIVEGEHCEKCGQKIDLSQYHK